MSEEKYGNNEPVCQKYYMYLTKLRAWFPKGQNNGQLGIQGDKKINYESFVVVLV